MDGLKIEEVIIINQWGQVVNHVKEQQGVIEIRLQTSKLPSAGYHLRIMTNKGIINKRINVIH